MKPAAARKLKAALSLFFSCLICGCQNSGPSAANIDTNAEFGLSNDAYHLDTQGGDDISNSFYGEEQPVSEADLSQMSEILTTKIETPKNAARSGITIIKSEVSEKASFYPAKIDGASMEVMAVRTSDGTILTAFNTSQICYNTGKGYFIQDEGMLECQNCGKLFPLDQIESAGSECCPLPILPSNKEENEDEIFIPIGFLKQFKSIFANWKD